ncbi:MAG: 4-oxalomesaconate tautomerase [Terracoccus sp.]
MSQFTSGMPSTQTSIPCMFMRGGTSRGPYFRAEDLPGDVRTRDAVLLAVMGCPDRRQIDGLGGAHPLTSKVAIVARTEREGVDVEFLFAQLQPDSDVVDTTPNCGNMLAGVVPFAVEAGLLLPQSDVTTARVLTLNTNMVAEIAIQTPLVGGVRCVEYAGDARIDGVPGTSAPITINFLDTAGSVAPGLLPTGHVRDTVDVPGVGRIDVTCIDNGMPLVILEAAAIGRTGYESVPDLNADAELKGRLESLRLHCGVVMGLGDVGPKNYPKMTLVAPPRNGGAICTRSFIPRVAHESIGVLAAVTVGTACVLHGSVAADVADCGTLSSDGSRSLSIEHPTGEFIVELGIDPDDPQKVTRAALLRTARLIMRGEVMVPRAVWSPGGSASVPPSK